ncbi:MAG: hypothetical protein MHM6MM_000816 [Cercozoa sp. M6MM]
MESRILCGSLHVCRANRSRGRRRRQFVLTSESLKVYNTNDNVAKKQPRACVPLEQLEGVRGPAKEYFQVFVLPTAPKNELFGTEKVVLLCAKDEESAQAWVHQLKLAIRGVKSRNGGGSVDSVSTTRTSVREDSATTSDSTGNCESELLDEIGSLLERCRWPRGATQHFLKQRLGNNLRGVLFVLSLLSYARSEGQDLPAMLIRLLTTDHTADITTTSTDDVAAGSGTGGFLSHVRALDKALLLDAVHRHSPALRTALTEILSAEPVGTNDLNDIDKVECITTVPVSLLLRNVTLKLLCLLGEDMERIAMQFCAAEKMDVAAADALLACLIQETPWLQRDVLANSQFTLLVRRPEMWRAHLLALAGSNFILRAIALREINSLLLHHGSNCDSLLSLNQWQRVVLPLLLDVPLLESNRSAAQQKVFQYTLNIFTLLLSHRCLSRRATLGHDVSLTLGVVAAIAPPCASTVMLCCSILRSLFSKLRGVSSHSHFPYIEQNEVPWNNLRGLLLVTEAFIFRAPSWLRPTLTDTKSTDMVLQTKLTAQQIAQVAPVALLAASSLSSVNSNEPPENNDDDVGLRPMCGEAYPEQEVAHQAASLLEDMGLAPGKLQDSLASQPGMDSRHCRALLRFSESAVFFRDAELFLMTAAHYRNSMAQGDAFEVVLRRVTQKFLLAVPQERRKAFAEENFRQSHTPRKDRFKGTMKRLRRRGGRRVPAIPSWALGEDSPRRRLSIFRSSPSSPSPLASPLPNKARGEQE